jgi:uncharacterized lipoprotein YddW (UPF0748 family)
MQKTQINKFTPSSEVDCNELLVDWPNWRREQLVAILTVQESRRIFLSDVLNIEVDSEFWFIFASMILLQSVGSLSFRNICL